jgi:hypothetical protein
MSGTSSPPHAARRSNASCAVRKPFPSVSNSAQRAWAARSAGAPSDASHSARVSTPSASASACVNLDLCGAVSGERWVRGGLRTDVQSAVSGSCGGIRKAASAGDEDRVAGWSFWSSVQPPSQLQQKMLLPRRQPVPPSHGGRDAPRADAAAPERARLAAVPPGVHDARDHAVARAAAHGRRAAVRSSAQGERRDGRDEEGEARHVGVCAERGPRGYEVRGGGGGVGLMGRYTLA